MLLLHTFLQLYFLMLAHAHHVSVTDIKYAPEAKSLQITQKVFLDDIESALKKSTGHPIDVVKLSTAGKLDAYLEKYTAQHFQVSVNNKPVTARFLGSEIQEDALWCYYEVAKVPMPEKVGVRNSILLEVYQDQVNLVHVGINKKVRSLKLSNDKKDGTVLF